MSHPIKVTVRYFAALREALGSGEPMELPEGSRLCDLRDALLARSQDHARLLARGTSVRCAVNQALVVDETQVLDAAAEVAFFPPVTGG